MGWNNPPVPWREFERRLSGSPPGPPPALADRTDGTADATDSGTAGGERITGPAPPPGDPAGPCQPYVELHCHSNFSFLDGASHPDELVAEAARLGVEALALTDHDGMYGVVRFAEAAATAGVGTVFGAELSLGPAGLGRGGTDRTGTPDPEGTHLLVLARDVEGYRRLCRAISEAQLAGGQKGRPRYHLDRLGEVATGHWVVLTGCRKGAVPAALGAGGAGSIREAAGELDRLVSVFGRDNVAVELWDHDRPADCDRNDALALVAARAGVPVLATNNVHHATPGRARLAAALAAVRARRGLDDLDGWLPPTGAAHLRSGAEMARRFARYPGAVTYAVELGRQCVFPLRHAAGDLPRFDVPAGHTAASYLRELTERGARERYGPPEHAPKAHAQIAHELDVIERQGYPGYFLIVWDIVRRCREVGVLCQGRGSAANSAVCYALGITSVDAVRFGLLFERFLSPERDGPPDIDIDIESHRREEIIQYVYRRYGRDRAAQVANVITYRPRSAVRDMARALGYDPGQQDAWSRQVDNHDPHALSVRSGRSEPAGQRGQDGKPDVAGGPDTGGPPDAVLELAGQVLGFPRHLGIHSAGMVLCDRPVSQVCPVEWARMPGRSVVQWDKDDCAAAGLVKFDLLGLGMLSALHDAFDLIEAHYGRRYTLATIPAEDPAVYDMLCQADSVGVFQVESRAQMATLPRLRPRSFYDLVVEVAIIRPGPIQGGSVHPYIRRHNGAEPVTYPHPLLRNALEKTKGVPLFQEQLMQIAIDAAGFTPAEADRLRQALGSKRSAERLERLRPRLLAGMAERDITPLVAEQIVDKLVAFADFGFPESHAVSFAYLVYASAWIKRHHPDVFCAALLNAQPMGFYSPQSLVADARRHGVRVLGPDLNASADRATLEPVPAGRHPDRHPDRRHGQERVRYAVRLGVGSVRTVGERAARQIAEGRPYESMADLAHRLELPAPVLEALATAGAFGCFGLDRRQALWAAGAVARERPGQLPIPGEPAPHLPGMGDRELMAADLWATGISSDGYPTRFLRERLTALGVTDAVRLRAVPTGRRVLVAGVVTHRQRPSTAGGTVFVNLEDETGHVNVICSPGVWQRYRQVGREAQAMLVAGRVETAEGVTNVTAERLAPLPLHTGERSRDFR
ncbi:MAG TPA: error-prone DNA polymerase [Mycobacteriales bacterium]|nr:error-prone DNA polymerase [Mycobacteriales bacterium]